MTTPISENPAVTNPMKALTAQQRKALSAVGFYRNQRDYGATWMLGSTRFPASTIEALRRLELVKATSGGGLDLTIAGTIARDKLKGTGNGNG
ncbi:hypothetical protein ACIQUB_07130 [Rhizobium sp. NPDC090275]|uniref:hypothetical protein n=1 Tax=Rhizobium sp. NPDC090275 TaxID=3364498 RepID=UPI00383A01D1